MYFVRITLNAGLSHNILNPPSNSLNCLSTDSSNIYFVYRSTYSVEGRFQQRRTKAGYFKIWTYWDWLIENDRSEYYRSFTSSIFVCKWYIFSSFLQWINSFLSKEFVFYGKRFNVYFFYISFELKQLEKAMLEWLIRDKRGVLL